MWYQKKIYVWIMDSHDCIGLIKPSWDYNSHNSLSCYFQVSLEFRVAILPKPIRHFLNIFWAKFSAGLPGAIAPHAHGHLSVSSSRCVGQQPDPRFLQLLLHLPFASPNPRTGVCLAPWQRVLDDLAWTPIVKTGGLGKVRAWYKFQAIPTAASYS